MKKTLKQFFSKFKKPIERKEIRIIGMEYLNDNIQQFNDLTNMIKNLEQNDVRKIYIGKMWAYTPTGKNIKYIANTLKTILTEERDTLSLKLKKDMKQIAKEISK